MVVCCSSACTQKRKSSGRTKTRTEQTVKLPNDAELVAKAKAGNARAQAFVARCYSNGTNGVKKNYKEAVKWAQKSADQGDAVGLYLLGVHYDKGLGVASNYTKANSLYKQALAKFKVEAENSDKISQSFLVECYYFGYGTDENFTEAVKWAQKSAEQGYAEAQSNLGYCYYNGYGVSQSYTQAVKWYRLAAEQGDAAAQYYLALSYANGEGISQSYTEAVKWYRLAAE